MRRRWRKAKPKLEKQFKSNKQIKVPVVYLIDVEGNNVGPIDTSKALAIAEEFDMDLVEVNPKADPPVVKILDLGQFKYEQDKREHKQKAQQKKIDIKGIRISFRISENDLNVRFKQSIKFLSQGNKLKVELNLKGRERQHLQKAREIMEQFRRDLNQVEDLNVIEEQALTKQGSKFSMILVNKTL